MNIDYNKESYDKDIICLYDVEYKQSFDLDFEFFLIKDLSGLSQVNFNNALYLCGCPKNTVNTGSYLIKYDPKKPYKQTSCLVSSIHNHYFPTIVGFKSDCLFVIGGEDNLKCEYYNLVTNKWKNMPSLPEERYKCNVTYDEENELFYLLGGYDSFTNNNKTTILKLNFRSLSEWEYIMVKKSHSLLARNSFALIKSDRNVVLLLGGIGDRNERLSSIIEVDLFDYKVTLSKKKLSKPASFIQVGGCDLNRTSYFLFDDEFQIHIINNNNYNIDLINYSELN